MRESLPPGWLPPAGGPPGSWDDRYATGRICGPARGIDGALVSEDCFIMAESNGECNGIANRRLLPQHLADLRKSGLSDATIDTCGFRSLQIPAWVQDVLHWKRYGGELGSCLCIPFIDAEGKPTGYCRLKPDKPRKGKKTASRTSTNARRVPPIAPTSRLEPWPH